MKLNSLFKKSILLFPIIFLLAYCLPAKSPSGGVFNELLVSSFQGRELAAVNMVKKIQAGSYFTESSVNQIVFSQNKLTAYLLEKNSKIEVINPYTLSLKKVINLPGQPISMAVSPIKSGLYGYVIVKDSPDLLIINLADNRVVDSIDVGGHLSSITVLSSGVVALLTDQLTNTVKVIDLVHKVVKANIGVCNNPDSIGYLPGSLVAYVLCRNSPEILPINLITYQVKPPIYMSSPGLSIVTDAKNLRAYVLLKDSNKINVLNLINATLENSINLSKGRPVALALSSDDSSLFVSDPSASKVLIYSSRYETMLGYLQLSFAPGEVVSN